MTPFSRFAAYFVEVARSGSLRKAAEKLHVSASAINRQILQAEESFAIALFERLPEGMRMTTAGELLYYDLVRWQREFSVTRQRFDDIQGLKRGQVSAGLVQALTEGKVAEELAMVACENEWLTLKLAVENSSTICRMIRDSEVDFGLILDPGAVSGLEVLAFAELEMGVILPSGHPLSTRESLTLGQLNRERHIIPQASLVVHERVISLYQRSGQFPENFISCNDISLIRNLVIQGAGICIMSWLDVMADVRSEQLSFVPLKNNLLRPLTLALCTAPSRQLSRAAQHVIQRLCGIIEALDRKAKNDDVNCLK
ncbi:LysR family transcriptional regulator [Erwinia psidii]|uniref:LysR family transcriptional regulator n=1 Tax=Erwinia psidii TaxID=69224 RepID=A0A3N6UTY6_9GAMM|nr:LysR family transcriptional regulator [Erwinia psidii]MCX8957999.1 LysR family transcriptional regulator [Erwinia psidii]MCX8962603.1 LysR family transcriptional regulator [Erwinia psidii]MCX8963926.1 LysR family transcriptional regulator [Erwinia psidii]RQM39419.1 LysR family transcriptional regulator [Erwinia psidii]